MRILEDWEAGSRTHPEYIPRLIAYQLEFEKLMKDRGEVYPSLEERLIADLRILSHRGLKELNAL